MRRYNKSEVRAKGYDSGVTLAVWFRELPDVIPVPTYCVEYSIEYQEEVKRGFAEKRRQLEKIIEDKKKGLCLDESREASSDFS